MNLVTIVSDSHRASEVFDNVQALFRGNDLGYETVDLNAIAVRVLSIVRADLEEHRITAVTELTSGLPHVMGHPGQMQEVLLNLVHNAIEAMNTIPDGRRVLHVRTEHHGSDAVAVIIEDSGPGIDPERLVGIFDPFVTTKPRGMGLGLAICRMTIESHGGELSASSLKDKGAVFRFTLPKAIREGADIASAIAS